LMVGLHASMARLDRAPVLLPVILDERRHAVS
jgi:hypothetical protein